MAFRIVGQKLGSLHQVWTGKKKEREERERRLKTDQQVIDEAMKGFLTVKQCLEDFKKKSCAKSAPAPNYGKRRRRQGNSYGKRRRRQGNSYGGRRGSSSGRRGFGRRRLLLDPPDNDKFLLDEGVADMQLTKPVQDRLNSQLNELQAEGISYKKFCSAW